MHGILYIVVMLFVIALLVSIPLFPFCKVWKRIKSHHQGLWASKGPFDIRTMAAHPTAFSGFLEIISLADRDEALRKKDPELIKWTRLAREVWKMAPRSFVGQVGYFLGFLWFVLLFTSIIMGILT